MNWFVDWLSQKPEGVWEVLFVAGMVCVDRGWNYIAQQVFPPEIPLHQQSHRTLMWGFDVEPYLSKSLLWAPLLEEATMRFIPIYMAQVFFGTPFAVYIAVILSSLCFGYIHNGFRSVPYQGVGGIFLSIVFLKCGAWNGNYLAGYVAAVAAHSFWNMWVIYENAFFGRIRFPKKWHPKAR